MICPKCKSECQEGNTVYSDCNEPLIKEGIKRTEKDKSNWSSKNWSALIAVIASLIAVLISLGTLYLTYFANYDLSIKESVNFVIGKQNNNTYIHIPLTINNYGAKPGIIDAFFMFIYTNEGDLFFKTGAFLETSELELNIHDLKPFTSFHIIGRNTEHKIIVSEIREKIKVGRYTCVVVAITSEKEKIYIKFKFSIDKDKLDVILAGGSVSFPTNKLAGITKEIEKEILNKGLNY